MANLEKLADLAASYAHGVRHFEPGTPEHTKAKTKFYETNELIRKLSNAASKGDDSMSKAVNHLNKTK